MMAEITSSQESLPLSQETFLYSWDGIPANLREVLLDTLRDPTTENNANFSEPPTVPILPANVLAPQQSSLPSTEDFPGFFNFAVTVPPHGVASKNSSYVYSSLLNRLYVKKDFPCPFNFTASDCLAELVEPSFVRATIYYSSPENINDVVIRCVNHKHPDMEKGDTLYEHLLRSESRSAEYYADSLSQRLSVVVPFDKPPVGQDFSTYVYRFLCYTSCSGGPNRRPICIVFTLENKGLIIGRRKIDIRVCSCPFRDQTADEKKVLSRENLQNAVPEVGSLKDIVSSGSSLSDITNDCKQVSKSSTKRKRDDNSDGGKEYIIKVRNEECYKLLKGVKVWYELVKHVQSENKWVPNVIDVANLLNVLTSSDDHSG